MRDDDWRGHAAAHDEEILGEARRVLADHPKASPPLLLWVNLLACRDVARVRFRQAHTEPDRACVAPVPPVAFDRRRVARSVNATLPMRLSDDLARALGIRTELTVDLMSSLLSSWAAEPTFTTTVDQMAAMLRWLKPAVERDPQLRATLEGTACIWVPERSALERRKKDRERSVPLGRIAGRFYRPSQCVREDHTGLIDSLKSTVSDEVVELAERGRHGPLEAVVGEPQRLQPRDEPERRRDPPSQIVGRECEANHAAAAAKHVSPGSRHARPAVHRAGAPV